MAKTTKEIIDVQKSNEKYCIENPDAKCNLFSNNATNMANLTQ